jgi:hypothetical protein
MGVFSMFDIDFTGVDWFVFGFYKNYSCLIVIDSQLVYVHSFIDAHVNSVIKVTIVEMNLPDEILFPQIPWLFCVIRCFCLAKETEIQLCL